MTHAFSTLDELGEGYGFRKIRTGLGVEAFGVNAIVMPPGMVAFWHYHDEQDELYFIHSGTALIEVGDPENPETRELGPGGLFHATAQVPRRLSNAGNDDLVFVVIGGKGGYVGRDGQLVNMDDFELRKSYGEGSKGSS